MITRKRIRISEKRLSLIWQRLLGEKLSTEEGKHLRLIYPGRVNGDNGPDFRDAVIAMNGSNLIKEDIEIHIKSSDWYSHKHHCDPEYNNVILHVVAQHDASLATLTQNGKSVPVLCLSPEPWHQAYLMPYFQLPCLWITKCKGRQALMELLDVAGRGRFKRKATLFRAVCHQEEAGQVLFQSMMRALGYSKNTMPFEELARRLPLNFMEGMELRESLVLKQAWLLGIAALLPFQRLDRRFPKEREVQELEQIWQSIGKGTETMSEDDWHLSRIYPNNSPVRRIIALSYLLQRYCREGLLVGMLQVVRDAPLVVGYRMLEDGLIVFGSGYWQEHFDFGAKTRKSALLGCSKAAEIVVNVILPFAFAWGEMVGESQLKEKAIKFYNHYPRLAENEITLHMARQLCLEGLSDFTACQQQGLIHIFRNYCREGRCSQCPLLS